MIKHIIAPLALIITLLSFSIPGIPQPAHAQSAPAPFLYRPYYGERTLFSRSISMFDHDEPWYANDGKFVRFDGTVVYNNSVYSCDPYQSCYDGHNGYDINMFYEPVLAAAAGTVVQAGWSDPSNHENGGGLTIAIDHGNGYATLYAHLDAILVTTGEQVSAQWQIATSGSTGDASGPHLHFSVFQLPNWLAVDPLGWQSTTMTDPNIVPDYYMFLPNPAAPTQAPCLGCDNGAAHPGAIVADDSSAGFSTTGTWNSATGSGYINGGMKWTYTASGQATATATWKTALPSSGVYEIGAYIDPQNAGSQWAPYTISHVNSAGAAESTTVWVDQEHVGSFTTPFGAINTGPQWIGLGEYYFSAGAPAQVTLSNATGETSVQLGADAIEFIPVPLGANMLNGQ